MHELSIAQALVEQIEAVARAERAERVYGTRVSVGSLSGVEPDALELAFPVAAEGTVAEGSALTIELAPAAAACRKCGHRFTPEFPLFVCEACASPDVAVDGGRDLLLLSVDLETQQEDAS
jgi:hydrogenase nickel incorporation protein HypA/HybF